MAREKGEIGFAGTFETEASKPLDPRGLVSNKNDLLLTETWEALDGNTYVYPGMLVVVSSDLIEENNGIYILKQYDYTNINNWKKIGEVLHEAFTDLQGGAPNDHKHLTSEQLSIVTGLTYDLSTKVDKIEGKGLSSEDYTLEEKLKLSGITGSNTGDETAETIKSKLGITILSGDNTGDQDLSYLQPKESGKTLVLITDIEKIHTQNTDNKLITPNQNKIVAYTDNAGNFHIDGDIIQSGNTYQTHAEEIYTTKNEIILRENAIVGLATGEYSGLISKKYDGVNDGRLGFNKDGVAVVGDINNEQPIGTRELTPVDQGFSYWDNTSNIFKTKLLEINDINNLSTNLNSKENLINSGTTSQYYRGDKTWQILTASTIGLSNVDNTSDLNKPISTTTQNALNLKQNTLNGLGFIKVSGETINYINDDYLSLSGGSMNNTNLISNLNSELLNGLKSNNFSLTGHTHDIYEPLITGKTNGYVKYEDSKYIFVDEVYSLSGHNHNGVYQPVGNYLINNQNIIINGDVTGSGTTGITLTLKDVGTSGTYTKIITDSNGRVISGTTLIENDIPILSWNKINTGTTPTTLSGYGITDASNINHKHYQLYTPDGNSNFVFTDNANNLHINGNIIQSGSTYQTHIEQLYTEKNEIILRENAISGMVAGEYAGLIARNYDGTNDGRLGFDKDGFAVVGDVNNEQKIATRENNPVNFGYAYWNSGSQSFLTKILDSSDITGLTATLNSKENTIVSGTTSQYYRGDKTWQILSTSAVTENNNYLYFNNSRTLNVTLSGFSQNTGFTQLVNTDTLLTSFNKIDYDIYYLNTNKLNKTLTQNKLWIGDSTNVASEVDTITEWVVGASQPGQKEYKGLVTDMITSDSSIIQLPVIVHKNVILTSMTTIQLLSTLITGSYYVIESISLIGRGVTASQYPIISIGCNASSYNDIAASQTVSTIANGITTITLTSNASKALIQANSLMYLNITQPLIGAGTFEIIMKGYLSKL